MAALDLNHWANYDPLQSRLTRTNYDPLQNHLPQQIYSPKKEPILKTQILSTPFYSLPFFFSFSFHSFLSTFCLSNTQLIKIILSSLLEYIYTTFEKYNKFAKCVIVLLLSEVQSEDSNIRSSIEENQNGFNKTAHLLVLRYAGSKGEKLIRSMKNSLKCEIPTNVTIRVTYSGAILYSKFTNIKNKTVKEHQNDIVYYVKCPED